MKALYTRIKNSEWGEQGEHVQAVVSCLVKSGRQDALG